MRKDSHKKILITTIKLVAFILIVGLISKKFLAISAVGLIIMYVYLKIKNRHYCLFFIFYHY